MLVSLFRGNPDAFMGDNMNRLKAGAVLAVPAAETVKSISPSAAREVIVAQSNDFATYRQRLASGAPLATAQAASRQATGTVQARVEDRKQTAAAAPDKLKLSQGEAKAPGTEAKVSKDSERKDASARLAELSRNVDELKKLQQGTATVAATPAAPAAPAPGASPKPAVIAAAPVPAPAPVVPPTPVAAPAPVVTPAPAPVAVTAPPPAPPPPAAPVAAPSPAPAPKPTAKATAEEEPGVLASLLESPLLLPGAGVLVALLAGLGIYRLRGGMRKRPGETSFLESRLQPDSFFGASGGQRIDTKDAGSGSTSSSMSYSLSQLDAIGDVDPVAEADVYLAYGRDLQAEEILKEAMRANPDRLAIRTKLLEVYAKRRDTKGFELLATQLHAVTRGEGDDWAQAQAMGHEIDPENALYTPGGGPAHAGDDSDPIEVLNAPTVPHTAKPGPEAFQPAADSATLDGGLDLDLDLDVSGGEHAPHETTRPLQTGAEFGAAADSHGAARALGQGNAAAQAAPSPQQLNTLDFDLGSFETPAGGTASTASTVGTAAAADEFGEFTLPSAVMPEQFDAADPLTRKLELAEEFRQIGDIEGARDLLEEVLGKAEGALKAKAQGMLHGLG